MKKIYLVFILLFLTSCNYSFKDDVKEYKNFMYFYEENDMGGVVEISTPKLVIKNKTKLYKGKFEKKFSKMIYDTFSKSRISINVSNCKINQFYDNGRSKVIDICKKHDFKSDKNEKYNVQDIYIDSDKKAFVLNGYYKDNGSYNQVIRILDKKNQFINDIYVNGIVNQITLKGDYLYYTLSQSNVEKNGEIPTELRKQKIYYKEYETVLDTKGTASIDFFAFDEKSRLIVAEYNLDSKLTSVKRGEKIIKKIQNSRISLEEKLTNDSDRVIYSVITSKSEDEFEYGYIELENDKIIMSKSNCSVGDYIGSATNNNFFCFNKYKKEVNVYSFKSKITKTYNVPVKTEDENIWIYFLD